MRLASYRLTTFHSVDFHLLRHSSGSAPPGHSSRRQQNHAIGALAS